MQKKTTKAPAKAVKKKNPPVKKQDQKFSLKRLIMGGEKPDLTELETGSTTVLDILSPTTIDTKSRDYIVVDGVFRAYLYVAGYGYSTTVGSCWLAPLVETREGVNLSFIFKRQPKEKILSKIAQTTMVNRSRMRDVERYPPRLRGAGQRHQLRALPAGCYKPPGGGLLLHAHPRRGHRGGRGDPGAAGDGGEKAVQKLLYRKQLHLCQ